MQSIEGNVRKLLQSPTTRGATTKEFIYKYWQRFDGLEGRLNLSTIRKLTDPETIGRSRRRMLSNK